ncbi:MAG: PPK2 family polyphosphate kinase [Armatimonadota bacterium]
MPKVQPGDKVDLNKFDAADRGKFSEEEVIAKLAKLTERVSALQELMFAAGQTSLLIVLQGRDTSGKDGTIRHLLKFMNAQATRIAPFKVPTPVEIGHDFLWRIHQQTPMKGETVIFNRSHYEDVLVVRVHDIAPKEVWSKRYEHINNFEQLLADSGTIVLKFFLHISKDEQEERLIERGNDPIKSWKLSVGDWKEREFWDSYSEAYEDALAKCSTENAPWTVVPANHKWYRNYVITKAICEALEPFETLWRAKLAKLSEQMKAEVAEFRNSKA